MFVSDSGSVEILDDAIRELVGKHLAAMAAEASSTAAGETPTSGAKRRGRPPGSKNAAPPPAIEESNGVDLGALAAER